MTAPPDRPDTAPPAEGDRHELLEHLDLHAVVAILQRVYPHLDVAEIRLHLDRLLAEAATLPSR